MGSQQLLGTYDELPKDASTYKCAASISSTSTTWFDWVRLWPASELGYRKKQLGARIAPLRKGLQCGWNDPNFAFKSFAGFVLGYLGEDAGARSFLEGIIAGSGSADDKSVAKAALLLLGSPSGASKYHADVVSYASSSNVYVAAVCQASLAIVDKDDDIVSSKLLPKVSWTQPDTSANGNGLFQAHLVALVAWERRQWAPNVGDTGQVCFYEECSGGNNGGSDTTPPAAPVNLTCRSAGDGKLVVSWSPVAQDEKGKAEGTVSYKVYYGNTARPASAATPNDFSYAHSDATTAVSKEYAGQDAAKIYYFSAVALDAAGNVSKYSKEARCVAGDPGADDPGAGPDCDLATVTPASGKPPLTSSSMPRSARRKTASTFSGESR
jgi:hypothetical protein